MALMEKQELVDALRGPSEGLRDFLVENKSVLPEVWALKTLSETAGGDRHKDNFSHTIKVVAQCGADATDRTLLAALFHDVGKPPTRRFVDGKVTFHNHEAVGATLTAKRFRQLGWELNSITDIVALASRMQSSKDFSESGVRRLDREAGELWDEAIRLARADVTSKHKSVHDRVHSCLDALESRRQEVRSIDEYRAFRPVLNGHDLMELGYSGRTLGEAIKWLTEENRSGRLTDRDAALTKMKELYAATH